MKSISTGDHKAVKSIPICDCKLAKKHGNKVKCKFSRRKHVYHVPVFEDENSELCAYCGYHVEYWRDASISKKLKFDQIHYPGFSPDCLPAEVVNYKYTPADNWRDNRKFKIEESK